MQQCEQVNSSFLSMALSYLEVGRIAASADASVKNLGEYQNAVAYQLFHAIELFYKFMICSAGESIKYTHDLGELERQYKACYPDFRFHFENPFDFSSYEPCPLNPHEKQLMQSHLEQFKPAYMSQHLRYPPDHRTGGYSFNFQESYFSKLIEQFNEIASSAANKSIQPTAFGGG
ncbi:MAG TPA: hypothetical protein PK667_11345 [Nitrosomonas europaea]|uniref:hypothetical protein n=1 Tax=Nitrosomonas europaea TaxID=915 RepID=UPI002490732E|nr:hypothetical protein [Nitrosomonas europaea]HRN82867.1 hypothetical protein [Nitrosomonas europaea]HRO56838.1 hypothetical protein [Nitrosomonas europaea]HUM74772.1 hypothetical protein [Nitrosomonas europaea]